MNNFKSYILAAFMLTALFLMISGCADNAKSPETDNDEYNGIQALSGTYTVNLAEIKITITSNIEQKAINPLNQAVGSLAVTGDENTTLNHMMIIKESGFQVTRVINQSPITAFIIPAYPVYYMDFMRGIDFPVFGYTFTRMTSEGEKTYSIEDPKTIQMNMNTRILTADNALYTHENDSCYINGTVEPFQIDVPADTPVEAISMLIPIALLGTGGLELNEDGTFSGNIIFQEQSEDLAGTWALIGDNGIRFTAPVMNPAVDDTLNAVYELDNNRLTLTVTEDLLALLGEDQNYKELFEMIIALEENSLTGAEIMIKLTLLKTAPKAGLISGTSPVVLDPAQLKRWFYQIETEIENMKSGLE